MSQSQVNAALESLQRTMRANPRKEEPETEKPQPPAKVIQLPLWPQARRAAPNAFFRSALFPALDLKKERPLFREQQPIASVDGITVLFNGERFDQSDLDVYLELLDIAHFHPLGTECTFTAHAMLKRLGRATGNSDHQWLHKVLIRLRTSSIDITDHKKRYFGGLIEGGFKDELDKHYRVTINPNFAKMFGFGMWSSIDREQRCELGRNATAKALHAYYSTHAAPGAHNFETLAKIVGLSNSNKRQERARLIDAHERLKQIGFLKDYEVRGAASITADLHPTPGQARHIVQKTIQHRRNSDR